MDEREQLRQAISAVERQRAVLGETTANTAIAAMRARLDALDGNLGATQIAQQRKQVTVFFADVSGFTAMSEHMDHEEVNTVINSLWMRVDGAILAQGGRIDKHIGDAVMALFGAPTAREDDPERAVRAALQVQTEIEAWKQEFIEAGSHLLPQVMQLRVRIGINTGPALIGTVGTTAEYTAIGDTVNLANRVETSAPAGGILISHNTYRHVPGIFDLTALEPIRVKGKSEPIQVYLVKGIRPRSRRVTVRGVEGILPRTVGREKELAQLQSAFLLTDADSRTQLITIVAEAGTGKSRLLYEFMNWLESQPQEVRFFEGRATADMARIPSSLIRDMLASAFEIQDSDRAAVAREKLERGVQAVLFGKGDEQSAAHFIGQLIGLDFSSSPYLSGIITDARQIRDLAFHHLTRLFTEASRQHTLVMILEDIQWADNASLEFLDHLLEAAPNLRLLIVCSARAALFEHHPDWALESDQRIRLDLQPLAAEQCRELVVDILQRLPRIPESLIELIVDKAEGSPFYVEELVNVLIEGGVLLTGEPEWRVELEKLQELKVPSTLTGLLQARLDTLAPGDLQTIQQASIVGRVFWPSVLESMQNPDAGDPEGQSAVTGSLTALRSKELVFQNDQSAFADTAEFLFKNAVLHDVTYESVLLRLRRIYHLQVAQGLIRLGGERVAEYAGRVGEHYELAGEWSKAADWYVRAGNRAQDTFAAGEAADYYQKALRFYEQHARSETVTQQLEIRRRLGEVLIWQARYPEAMNNYEAMLQAAETASQALAQAHALLGMASCLGSQGDHREAMKRAVQAEELVTRIDARAEVAKALWFQGASCYRLGEGQGALARAEQALAIGKELGNRSEMARCLNLLGAANYSLGRYKESEKCWEDALALFQELGDQRQGMDLLNNLGVIAEAHGDHKTAFLRFNRALEIARGIGYRDGEIVFLTNRGGRQVVLGNYAEGETDLRQAIELAGKGGSWILPNTYYYLAEASVRTGKLEQALEEARKSFALGQADGGPEYIGVAYRALGMVAKEMGRRIAISDEAPAQECDAQELFQDSLRVLAEGNMDAERARTLREWAIYRLRDGDSEEGRKMWEEAREIYKSLGAELEVERMAQLPS